MAATVYGNGNWGVADESSNGLYIADLSVDGSEEEAFVPDHIGEDTGLALFNQQATVTGNGATATADTQGQTLGGVLSIASTALLGTDLWSTPKFYVNGISLGEQNRGFQTGGFTAVGRAGITAASGTEVS